MIIDHAIANKSLRVFALCIMQSKAYMHSSSLVEPCQQIWKYIFVMNEIGVMATFITRKISREA